MAHIGLRPSWEEAATGRICGSRGGSWQWPSEAMGERTVNGSRRVCERLLLLEAEAGEVGEGAKPARAADPGAGSPFPARFGGTGDDVHKWRWWFL